MRFNPEKGYGANAGLAIARDRLEPVKAAFPGLSYGDLWTLAGVVAVKAMGAHKCLCRRYPSLRLHGAKRGAGMRDIGHRSGATMA